MLLDIEILVWYEISVYQNENTILSSYYLLLC